VSHDIGCNLHYTRGKPAFTVVPRIWSTYPDCTSLTLACTYVRKTNKMHTSLNNLFYLDYPQHVLNKQLFIIRLFLCYTQHTVFYHLTP